MKLDLNAQFIAQVNWNAAGLAPAIAQQYDSGLVLMLAWMNAESLAATVAEGRAVYYSRSRKKLWRKGEESGHIQTLHEIRLDCDGDTLLLKVDQTGGIACHTGRAHCFYRRLDGEIWRDAEPILKDPREIYSA